MKEDKFTIKDNGTFFDLELKSVGQSSLHLEQKKISGAVHTVALVKAAIPELIKRLQRAEKGEPMADPPRFQVVEAGRCFIIADTKIGGFVTDSGGRNAELIDHGWYSDDCCAHVFLVFDAAKRVADKLNKEL